MMYSLDYLEDARSSAAPEVAYLVGLLLDGEMTMAEFEDAAADITRRTTR